MFISLFLQLSSFVIIVRAVIPIGMTNLSIVNWIPRSVEKNLNCRRIRRTGSAGIVQRLWFATGGRESWHRGLPLWFPWSTKLGLYRECWRRRSKVVQTPATRQWMYRRKLLRWFLGLLQKASERWMTFHVLRLSLVSRGRPMSATKVMPVSLMGPKVSMASGMKCWEGIDISCSFWRLPILLRLLSLRLLVDRVVLECRWQSRPIQDYDPLSVGWEWYRPVSYHPTAAYPVAL